MSNRDVNGVDVPLSLIEEIDIYEEDYSKGILVCKLTDCSTKHVEHRARILSPHDLLVAKS